jgi:hypothetical protein
VTELHLNNMSKEEILLEQIVEAVHSHLEGMEDGSFQDRLLTVPIGLDGALSLLPLMDLNDHSPCYLTVC